MQEIERVVAFLQREELKLAISQGKPDAVTKAAAMLNSFLLTVNR